MDAHIDDQQQKDYLSPFFDLESLQNGGDLGIMSPSMNSQQPQLMMTSATMPSQMDMEMLGNLMSLQGINSPNDISQRPPLSPQFSTNTGATSPQLLMEQQFKLAQLQQLQQLQNQIFQQQVRSLDLGGDEEDLFLLEDSPCIFHSNKPFKLRVL